MTLLPLSLVVLLSTATFAQTKPKARPNPAKLPTAVPVKAGIATFDKGSVTGRTYTNRSLGFEVTFPDTWLIPGDDFVDYMKKQGFDLSLKAPDYLPANSKVKIDQALKRVHVLLTAYRSMPGSTDNAIARISIEDLSANSQIKDAVDYIDAIRASYSTMKLPADFRYSETQAEKLGAMQFAFIGTSSNAGNKVLYATVRNGYAVLFTISFSDKADLETFRQVLARGNFALK